MSPRKSARPEHKGPAYAFWERVERERKRLGLTQSQLQGESGIDRTTLYRMKTAKPQADTVLALAEVLNIDQDEALELAGVITREVAPEPVVESGLGVDEETEALLAKLSPRRRAILEQMRNAERERFRRLQEQVAAEGAEAERRFAELVRIEIEESDNS
ncbi:helix-turn-helix transcriptional regulator [Nonomuraea sp. NPDC050643]|uniref:helix-turn-helix domain-containing protein n=1 Tax=Nonomuraea sp. NPDC050643 TaxID=3155660 RepID=UPI0033EFF78C